MVAAVGRPVFFLDDGGVMNENSRRGLQWHHLVGQYLAPRLGGMPEAWAAANAEVAERLFWEYEVRLREEPGASWTVYWADYEEAWLGGMCAVVGVAPPVGEAAWQRLGRACEAYVTRRVRAAFPGAVGAIRWLHRAGYRLHTASAEPSWQLDGYLIGMRVRTCFGGLYGPDQVNTAKSSPLYYQQVFADAGVAPGDAVVVDDSERALNWASEVGAETVLCGPAPPTNRRHRHVRWLTELSRLLGDVTAVWQNVR